MHPVTLLPRLERFLCTLTLAAAFPVLAQDIHHYNAVVSGMTTTMQEKQLLMDLAGSDELGEFSIDRSAGAIVLKTVRRFDLAQFDHFVGRYGMHLVSFEEINAAPAVVVRTPRVPRMADMPLYMDTGNPVQDDQRYDAYKAAWIAVHPEEYRELTAPQGPAPTSEND